MLEHRNVNLLLQPDVYDEFIAVLTNYEADIITNLKLDTHQTLPYYQGQLQLLDILKKLRENVKSLRELKHNGQ